MAIKFRIAIQRDHHLEKRKKFGCTDAFTVDRETEPHDHEIAFF
jgi:hypothetical protein